MTLDENASSEDFDCLGDMLKSVLLKVRDERAFDKLPLANLTVMALEEINGSFGWPEYEKLNSVANVRIV